MVLQVAEAVSTSEVTARIFKIIPNPMSLPRRIIEALYVIRRNWQLCPLHACKADRPKAGRTSRPTCPALPASLLRAQPNRLAVDFEDGRESALKLPSIGLDLPRPLNPAQEGGDGLPWLDRCPGYFHARHDHVHHGPPSGRLCPHAALPWLPTIERSVHQPPFWKLMEPSATMRSNAGLPLVAAVNRSRWRRSSNDPVRLGESAARTTNLSTIAKRQRPSSRIDLDQPVRDLFDQSVLEMHGRRRIYFVEVFGDKYAPTPS